MFCDETYGHDLEKYLEEYGRSDKDNVTGKVTAEPSVTPSTGFFDNESLD